ncbi:hypothetical protein CCHR01_02612 [Colletotrichum chrysophilum]|uniref:Uncharacterized protein n=1 Tax=Colletotrichum chrysophilum TaxID=1836956 RepID=A0AAD9AUG8_9PEZI|nr:hypothetical protein CCHR01_02612 [Colletotrichum chrysophilum]
MQAILLQHSVKHPSPPEPHVTTSRRHDVTAIIQSSPSHLSSPGPPSAGQCPVAGSSVATTASKCCPTFHCQHPKVDSRKLRPPRQPLPNLAAKSLGFSPACIHKPSH